MLRITQLEVTTRTKCWVLGANPRQPIDLTQSKFQLAFLTRQWADTWAERRIHSMEIGHRPLLSPGLLRQLWGDYLTFLLSHQDPAIICCLLSSPSFPRHHLCSHLFSPPLFLVKLTDQDEDSVCGSEGPEITSFVDSKQLECSNFIL